jgi:hypothetical protein
LSLQFSRSMRALRLDSFRLSRVGLILALLNMVALLAWFFFVQVTMYEVSPALSPGDQGHLLVSFSPEAFSRIRVGESALVRLNASGDQAGGAYPAMVFDINRDKNQADLYLLPSENPPDLSGDKINGRAEVEVEYVTPFELILRNSGRFMNQAVIQVSQPQSTQEAR